MRSVRLILREDIPGLGEAGDLVGVKVGYARNYLLPQGKAILATESKIAQLEHTKRVVSEKLGKELKDLETLRDRLQALELEVVAKAGEEGKLFGSVTSASPTCWPRKGLKSTAARSPSGSTSRRSASTRFRCGCAEISSPSSG
jgi:hypothetical protein